MSCTHRRHAKPLMCSERASFQNANQISKGVPVHSIDLCMFDTTAPSTPLQLDEKEFREVIGILKEVGDDGDGA